MGISDIFFPNKTLGNNLRNLVGAQRRTERGQINTFQFAAKRIEALEDDMGYVSLVLASLIQEIDDKGIITRSELRKVIKEVDSIDGAKDGRLDINVLKNLGQSD